MQPCRFTGRAGFRGAEALQMHADGLVKISPSTSRSGCNEGPCLNAAITSAWQADRRCGGRRATETAGVRDGRDSSAPARAAQPKSMSVHECCRGRRRMFPGLMSRWAHPDACSSFSRVATWHSTCTARQWVPYRIIVSRVWEATDRRPKEGTEH